jgi:hypothetical protein
VHQRGVDLRRPADCQDGADEAECDDGGCSELNVRCGDGACVPWTKACDGVADCTGAPLDERGCETLCGADQDECLDGSCVPAAAACDGVVAPAVRQSTDNRTHRHHRHLPQSQRPGTLAPPS